MKALVATCALGGAAILAGCATQVAAPAALTPGKFVNFACEGGKTFSARLAAGGSSVRVRSQHGSAELDSKGAGLYEGDGYRFVTQGSDAISLLYGGKPQGQRCKAA